SGIGRVSPPGPTSLHFRRASFWTMHHPFKCPRQRRDLRLLFGWRRDGRHPTDLIFDGTNRGGCHDDLPMMTACVTIDLNATSFDLYATLAQPGVSSAS